MPNYTETILDVTFNFYDYRAPQYQAVWDILNAAKNTSLGSNLFTAP